MVTITISLTHITTPMTGSRSRVCFVYICMVLHFIYTCVCLTHFIRV